MGDTTEAWRARVGLFAGGSRKMKPKSSRHDYTFSQFWAMIAAVAVISFVIPLNYPGLSPPLKPISLRCSSQDKPLCAQNAIISTLAVVLLFSTRLDPAVKTQAPSRRIFHNASNQHSVENSFILVVIAFAIISTLLLRGGIEPNPGPFPCRLCSVVPETIASSIRHQLFHVKNKHFVYYCPACEFRSTSYGSLNFHVSTHHAETRHIDPDVTEKISCNHTVNGIRCVFSVTSFWLLVQHLCHHLKDDKITIQCPVSGCKFKKGFVKAGNFRNHLSVWHKTWREEGCPIKVTEQHKQFVSTSPTLQPIPLEFPSGADVGFNLTEDNMPSNENSNINGDLLNDQLVLDNIAKFYLHMYAQNLLPAETIQEICDNLIFLTEVVQARIKLILTRELQALDCNIPQDKINLVHMKVLEADLLYLSHHKSTGYPTLSSDHLRKKYFKDHFDFAEPKQINLEPADPSSKNTLQFVSIPQSLNKFLQDTSIQREVDASFEVQQGKDPDVLSNYTDGELFKSENHPAKEIHLTLYQDSFNPVMNALGSAKNKFKDLVVYFTISNIRPHLRSLIDSKQLILLCRESVFKKFGAKKCLAEMMSELKKLELTGILYKGEWIKVCVQYMLGDNLGQHLIGGFIENFSGQFFCRFCEIKKSEFRENPSITKPPRSLQEYKRCALKASLLDKPVKGIKQDCELNSLKYFSSVSHLPVDLAHDLFEGVVSWDLSGIIARFVGMKWFTYELLNRRIKNFKCIGIDRRNKPAFVNKKGGTLGGHAVQNWMMLRLFYLIIGDKIQDQNDPGWLLYLQLKEMCEIICAPSIPKAQVVYLKDVLIPAYFDRRRSVLCEKTYKLKPKHHFLAHYSELMLKYGPLIQVWTMPYEQKHKFFKELIRKTKNFINPEKTCAVRQQMKFAYSTSSTLFDEGLIIESKPKVLSPTSFTGDLAYFISNLNWRNYSDSSSVTSDGITFKKEDKLILSATGTSTIIVGIIKVIAVKDNMLKFIVQKRLATYQNYKGIYEIDMKNLGDFSIVPVSSLKYPVPQPVYIYSGKSCFSLKHSII